MANKPVSLIRDELVQKLVTAINESNLSYFILEYILKDLLNEVHNAAVQQAQREKAQYLQMEAQATKADAEAENANKETVVAVNEVAN